MLPVVPPLVRRGPGGGGDAAAPPAPGGGGTKKGLRKGRKRPRPRPVVRKGAPGGAASKVDGPRPSPASASAGAGGGGGTAAPGGTIPGATEGTTATAMHNPPGDDGAGSPAAGAATAPPPQPPVPPPPVPLARPLLAPLPPNPARTSGAATSKSKRSKPTVRPKKKKKKKGTKERGTTATAIAAVADPRRERRPPQPPQQRPPEAEARGGEFGGVGGGFGGGVGGGGGAGAREEEEEDPLILAAEAAAALLEQQQHRVADADDGDGDGLELTQGLLDAAELAAAAMMGGAVDADAAVVDGGERAERAGDSAPVPVPALPPMEEEPPRSPESHPPCFHPLGGDGSAVVTVSSKLPRVAEVSVAQRDFVRRYCAQTEVADMLGLGRGGGTAAGRRGEEVVDDADDAEEDAEAVGEGKAQGREDGEGTSGEGGTEGEATRASGGDGTVAAGDAVGVEMEEEERPTLRAALKKLRRSTYPRASKRAKAAAKDAGESAPDLGGAGTATDPVAAEDRTDLAEVPAVDAAGGAAGRGAERTTEEIEEASASAEGAPRVELDASGVLIVSGSSLARDPRDRVSATDVDREYGDAVVDDEDIQGNAGIVRGSYLDHRPPGRFDSHDGDGEGGPRKPKRWGVEETRTFFRALRTCGADFGLMGTYLPGRSRSQLKRKFRTESRKHPRLVDLALDPRGGGRLDLSVFGADLEIPDAVPVLPSKTATAAAGLKKQEQDAAAPEATQPGGDVPGGGAGEVAGFGADSAGGGDRGGDAEEEAQGEAEPARETNFDRLFDEGDDEGDDRGGGADVVETAADGAAEGSAKASAKDATKEAAKDASTDERAALPLAPVAPSRAKGTTKRARFKVRPKGGGGKKKPAKKR